MNPLLLRVRAAIRLADPSLEQDWEAWLFKLSKCLLMAENAKECCAVIKSILDLDER